MGGVKLATVNRIGGSSQNFARPYLFDLTVANGHRTVGGIADICIVQSVYIFRSGLVCSSNGYRIRSQGNGIWHQSLGFRTNSNTLGSCLRATTECDGVFRLCVGTTTNSQRILACGVGIVTQSHSLCRICTGRSADGYGKISGSLHTVTDSHALLSIGLGSRTDTNSHSSFGFHVITDSNGIRLTIGSLQSIAATNADAVVARSTVTQADNAAIYIQTATERKVFTTRTTRIAMEQSTVGLAGSICRATFITEGICTRHTTAAGLPGRPFQVVISQKEQRVSS